jgi:hypothetical protein
MFDELVTKALSASGADAAAGFGRVENAACARRLAAMVAMLDAAYAEAGSADRDEWCVDNWATVSARIATALHVSKRTASHQLIVALALRDRLRQVGALFADGLISYRMVATIAWRTALLDDPSALREVDACLAADVRRWGALSTKKTIDQIDTVVAAYDSYAVRRTESKTDDRYATFEAAQDDAGYTYLFARLFSTDADAGRQRLDALAHTVCPNDPRTLKQRRADAFGALANGNDRLACQCGSEDCQAFANPPATGVIIHAIAHAATLERSGPAVPDGSDSDGSGQPDEPDELDESDEPDESAEPDEPDELGQSHDSSDGNHAGAAQGASESDEVARQGPDLRPPPKHHESIYIPPSLDALDAQRVEDCEEHAAIPPAYLMGKGGGVLPGVLLEYVAPGAMVRPIVHPGNAPPEAGYRPSLALADFIRARDLTCRFPNCDVPATACDLDHVDPWPYGATCASNLNCKCRFHHLLKTFCGWSDRQLPDGTVIWTAPDGQAYTTHPGSSLLFPSLCLPTAPAPKAELPPENPDKGRLIMPRRKVTRADARKQRIAAERALNAADHTRQPAAAPPF